MLNNSHYSSLYHITMVAFSNEVRGNLLSQFLTCWWSSQSPWLVSPHLSCLQFTAAGHIEKWTILFCALMNVTAIQLIHAPKVSSFLRWHPNKWTSSLTPGYLLLIFKCYLCSYLSLQQKATVERHRSVINKPSISIATNVAVRRFGHPSLRTQKMP